MVCGKLSFRPALVTMKKCLHEHAKECGFISQLSELKVSFGWGRGGEEGEEEGGGGREEKRKEGGGGGGGGGGRKSGKEEEREEDRKTGGEGKMEE